MSTSKVLNGRAATQADVDAGRVVFFIPGNRSVPYSLGRALPLTARVVECDDDNEFLPPGTEVRIVQAELVDGKHVMLGVLYGDAGEGICALEDIHLLGGE